MKVLISKGLVWLSSRKAILGRFRAFTQKEFTETGCSKVNSEKIVQGLAESMNEARLGELLDKIKQKYVSSGRGTIEKQPSLPPGINKKQSHYAQELLVAREMLSSTWEDQERSTDGKFVPPDKTWNQYCQDIGKKNEKYH